MFLLISDNIGTPLPLVLSCLVGLSSGVSRLLIPWGAARLAEVEEGESEAHLGAEAEEILPCSDMVDFADETIDRRWGGASAVSVGRFGKKA